MSESPEAWRESFYRRYYGVTEGQGVKHFWRFTDLSLCAMYGLEQTKEVFWNFFAVPRHEDYENDGWFRATQASTGIEWDALKRVQFLNGCMDRRWRLKNVEALYELIARAQGRGVSVVFVTLPVHESYARTMSRDHWTSASRTILSICEKSHSLYFNHFQDSAFNAGDYSDSDHLNEKGARKISRILAADLGLAPARGPRI